MDLLGKNISHYRRLKGITQKELAEKTGLSRSFISQIENGTNTPSGDSLFKISNILGVTVDELKSNDKSPLMEVINLLNKLTEKEIIKWDWWDKNLDYDQMVVFESEINKTKYIFVYIRSYEIDSNSYEADILDKLGVNDSCLIIGGGQPLYSGYDSDEEKAFKSLYDTIMINQHDQTNVYKSINDLKNLLDKE